MQILRKQFIVHTLVVLAVGYFVLPARAANRAIQDQESEMNQPASLARKRHCLEAEIQKWQDEGKDLQPIAEILQEFPPLFQHQKYAEAEQVVDRAIKVSGATCPDQPTSFVSGTQGSSTTEPPASLQEKMHRLQSLIEPRMAGEQGDATDLQPVVEIMQRVGPLIQQQKFADAEALVDRALKLLGASASTSSSSAAGDSSLIAYAALDSDGRQQIFVVKPDGAENRRLTQEGKRNLSPVWSPDGTKVAFASDRSSSLQIWLMNADGSNPRQLTTEGENEMPTWSPDGRRLAFSSNRTGHVEIWTMNSDGSNQRVLIADPAKLSGPSWQPAVRKH
jgi:hypothetical protein